MGYFQLARLRGSRPRGIVSEDLEAMLFANENYTAGLVMERLDDVCRVPTSAVGRACSILMAWDRRNAAGSRGAALYREFWRRAQKIRGLWAIHFTAHQPLASPRELNLHDDRVREQVQQTLREAVAVFDELGIALDAPLGDLQYRTTKSGLIPIAGGTDRRCLEPSPLRPSHEKRV
jgi:acyl-homoserine-lactone acylase